MIVFFFAKYCIIQKDDENKFLIHLRIMAATKSNKNVTNTKLWSALFFIICDWQFHVSKLYVFKLTEKRPDIIGCKNPPNDKIETIKFIFGDILNPQKLLTVFGKEQLSSVKKRELQSLAKKHGLKDTEPSANIVQKLLAVFEKEEEYKNDEIQENKKEEKEGAEHDECGAVSKEAKNDALKSPFSALDAGGSKSNCLVSSDQGYVSSCRVESTPATKDAYPIERDYNAQVEDEQTKITVLFFFVRKGKGVREKTGFFGEIHKNWLCGTTQPKVKRPREDSQKSNVKMPGAAADVAHEENRRPLPNCLLFFVVQKKKVFSKSFCFVIFVKLRTHFIGGEKKETFNLFFMLLLDACEDDEGDIGAEERPCPNLTAQRPETLEGTIKTTEGLALLITFVLLANK
ncbi:hypothetical protein RFI_14558 [Reticulomyxa filosa]|uniref:SAP domain-containing protein n=1 Tax=Reticulomyxa filosa TaxID=46433 RepID=X6NA47_RETFI|nr:hypothetical protein RFI_14558 [Reticulomyxa filosa]|eukprot:ETO22639.1 hypothetical protein RFI_14558 [Reticulomyxa filosa]